MKKAVAILTPTFPPYRGGIGKVAQQDAEQLSSLGHDVHVFTPRTGQEHGSERGDYTVHEMKTVGRFGNAAFVPAARRLRSEYETVVLHYPFFGGAEPVALFSGRSKGSRLITVYHMDVIGRGFLSAVFRLHTKLILPSVLGRADRILVTSFDYAHTSNIRDLLHAKEGSFRELPPSVDVKRFCPGEKPSGLMERYGLKGEDRIVLLVGGLDQAHYFKGVPILLQALTVRGLERMKAVLVGDGDLKESFRKRAEDLGVADRVIFAGSVSEEELPDHYRLADVFAFPSIDRSEAFGIAALEALSTGVPVIASDLHGVRTIVRDGENGFRIRPGSVSALASRMIDLMGDDGLRGRFSEAARAMAEKEYSEASRTERWRAIIEERT